MTRHRLYVLSSSSIDVNDVLANSSNIIIKDSHA
jgi:hypothetical protein